MPLTGLRIARPRRLALRVVFELAAAAVWPLQVVGIMLLPLAPFTAIATAEVERWRARACGEDVAPLHPADGAPAWAWHRAATRALWRTDAPITLASLVLGAVSGLAAVLGGLGGAVLVAAPVFHATKVYVNVGPWVGDTAARAWTMVPVGITVLAGTLAVLLGASVARDAAVRVLGGQEAQRLSRELGSVRTSRAAMLEAFDAERRRIERDLHDGAQQDLVALSITLGMLEHTAASLPGAEAGRVQTLARRAHEQAERSLVRLRETVHGIHPRELTDLGLFAALRQLADRSPLQVDLRASGDDASVPPAVAAAVYFVVAEALTNATVHAGVERAEVGAEVGDGLRVVVRDTGRGGARLDSSGTGLAGLRERVRALGGELAVDSPADVGTTITATVPLSPTWDDEAMMGA
ncbi:sensor histidine kinase [Mariniluteicoccus endophyticus]